MAARPRKCLTSKYITQDDPDQIKRFTIICAVAARYGVDPDLIRERDVLTKPRPDGTTLALARQVAAYVLHGVGYGHGAIAMVLEREKSTIYKVLSRIKERTQVGNPPTWVPFAEQLIAQFRTGLAPALTEFPAPRPTETMARASVPSHLHTVLPGLDPAVIDYVQCTMVGASHTHRCQCQRGFALLLANPNWATMVRLALDNIGQRGFADLLTRRLAA